MKLSRRDLDILPGAAHKGSALQWLCSALSIALDRVVVAGDSGNDSAMFALPRVRSIVVANTQEELRGYVPSLRQFKSTKAFADGVIDGLCHFGLFSSEPNYLHE